MTIREIIVQHGHERRGVGRSMLARLCRDVPGATSIFARCPADLPANSWYQRMGFVREAVETTSRGRALNCWRLALGRGEEGGGR